MPRGFPGSSGEAAGRNVTVLSVGAWGVVLASHLARKGHRVVGFDLPGVLEALKETGGHAKLPGFKVPQSLRLTADLEEALVGSEPDCVVVTTPGQAMRSVLERCRELESKSGGGGSAEAGTPWVICTKSIEENSLMTMSELVESVRGESCRDRLAVLSGPSFAAEVAVGKPTTVSVASTNGETSAFVQQLFMTDDFRVYTQDDVLGVELGGALKNVIAIAAGACDGLELGDNARAALITRGLAEMVRLGVARGARSETFAGLTGMGDLILTCGGTLSRNHQFGELLAKGCTTDEALERIGMVVEGMGTARSVRALSLRHGVEMPIAKEVHAVIYEGKSPKEAVGDLMRREARPERD